MLRWLCLRVVAKFRIAVSQPAASDKPERGRLMQTQPRFLREAHGMVRACYRASRMSLESRVESFEVKWMVGKFGAEIDFPG